MGSKKTEVAPVNEVSAEQFAAAFSTAQNCDVSSAINETSPFFKPTPGEVGLYLIADKEEVDNPNPQKGAPAMIEGVVLYDKHRNKIIALDAVICSTFDRMKEAGNIPCMCFITATGTRTSGTGKEYNSFEIRRIPMAIG